MKGFKEKACEILIQPFVSYHYYQSGQSVFQQSGPSYLQIINKKCQSCTIYMYQKSIAVL